MSTRSAYIQDSEPTPKVFILEQTDFRGYERNEIMSKIRSKIEQHQENPKELALHLKEMLDEECGRYWHVVVGTDYAA